MPRPRKVTARYVRHTSGKARAIWYDATGTRRERLLPGPRPFCGSGTRLIAAAIEGRSAVGVEVDPRWCQMIRERVDRYECRGVGNLFSDEVKMGS